MGNMTLILTLCCCMLVFTAQGNKAPTKFAPLKVGDILNVPFNCHCEDKKCNETGHCLNGSYCEKGWFGSRCQYVDLASNPSDILLDGNDSTCNPDVDIAIVDLHRQIPFHWLRLVSDVANGKVLAEPSHTLRVYFHNSENPEAPSVIKCNGMKYERVNDRTVDISCDLTSTVDLVVLSGGVVKSLCSIYISGACQSGYYGPDCKSKCSAFCLDRDCDPVSGDCLICKPGFQGRLCNEECPATFYGQNCAKKCSVNCLDQLCYHENGKCVACVDGWSGDYCQDKSPAKAKAT
ncbi:protein draper-like [Physella acuta]|uniref:protein draper-like n=1 Tax=Physella acuta TaxID=109671 RepID=UPI0027DDEA3C|nr:protein draper-like [Physella acuta]